MCTASILLRMPNCIHGLHIAKLCIRCLSPHPREHTRQGRIDGDKTGANDGKVDLSNGPRRHDDGDAVSEGHAADELQGSDEGDDADARYVKRSCQLWARGADEVRQRSDAQKRKHKHNRQRILLPPRNTQFAQHRQRQGKYEEISDDVDPSVTPKHIELVAIRASAFWDVPEGVEGDADGEDGDNDPDVGDDDDREDDPGGEVDVVVAESAEIET